MLYPSLKDMPYLTGVGFEHMVGKFGRTGQTSAEAFHEMYARTQERESREHHESLMQPTRY